MHYGLPPLAGEDGGGMTWIDKFLNHRQREHVLLVRDTKVAFPLPKSSDGRPTHVILEPAGYRPTAGVPMVSCS